MCSAAGLVLVFASSRLLAPLVSLWDEIKTTMTSESRIAAQLASMSLASSLERFC